MPRPARRVCVSKSRKARERPERLAAVLEGIYDAYTIGSSLVSSVNAAALPAELSTEAQHLARLVARLEPDSAEAQGLLSLMPLYEGRRHAQFDRDGRFVPLLQTPGPFPRRMVHPPPL
jgi:RNA polymerase sigma-70 factor (ECF subfamily)